MISVMDEKDQTQTRITVVEDTTPNKPPFSPGHERH